MSRARISPGQIAVLKDRVSLAAVIGGSVVLQKDGAEYIALCPFHAEDTPSFRVWRDHAHCFGCGWHGDAIDWLVERERMSFMGAVRHLREWSGAAEPVEREIERSTRGDNYGWVPVLPVPANAPPLIDRKGTVRAFNPKRQGTSWEWTRWRPAMKFPYRDAAGDLLGYVLRVEKREGGKFTPALTFCQHKSGERRWCVIPLPSPRPLYGVDQLAAAPGATVIAVEGEKTCEAARRLLPSFLSVTWAGGGKAYHLTDWTSLRGRKVICIPDADNEGRNAFDGRVTARGRRVPGILEILAGIGATARRVEPPSSLPDGWDLADAEKDGWDTARAMAWLTANLLEPRRAA